MFNPDKRLLIGLMVVVIAVIAIITMSNNPNSDPPDNRPTIEYFSYVDYSISGGTIDIDEYDTNDVYRATAHNYNGVARSVVIIKNIDVEGGVIPTDWDLIAVCEKSSGEQFEWSIKSSTYSSQWELGVGEMGWYRTYSDYPFDSTDNHSSIKILYTYVKSNDFKCVWNNSLEHECFS